MAITPNLARVMRKRLAEIDHEREKLHRRLEELSSEAASLSTALDPAGKGPNFASQIRQALASFGRPATPSEVTKKLVSAGLHWTNPRLQVRSAVNLQLYKMSQRPTTSKVTKTERGKYSYSG
jgi:hypothetical protein